MSPLSLPTPWADWSVLVHPMPAREVIVTRARLFLIAPDVTDDPVRHAVAHLELGHHDQPGAITDDMEQWARQLAELLTVPAAA